MRFSHGTANKTVLGKWCERIHLTSHGCSILELLNIVSSAKHSTTELIP